MKSMTFLVKILKRNGNIYENLNGFFRLDSGVNYAMFLDHLSHAADLQKIITKPVYQNSLDEVKNWFFLKNLPLSKVLLWNCQYFTQYSTELNQFEKLKSMFENLFLSKKYSDCLRVLEKVEKQFGVSMWLIENYVILGTFDLNIDDYQKKFDGRALDMFQIFSIKNNINEQNSYYRKRLSGFFENSDLNDILKDYYTYKLSYDSIRTEQEWSNVLFFETNFSLIDLYLTTKVCLQQRQSWEKTSISQRLDECYKSVFSINLSNDIAFLEEFLESFDNEQYKNVIQCFYSESFNSYDIFATYKLTVLSMLISNIKPDDTTDIVSNRIVCDMFHILGRSEQFLSALNDLEILTRILQPFNFNKSLWFFISLICNSEENSISEQCYAFADVFFLKHEIKASSPLLIPYKSMYMSGNNMFLEGVEEFLCKNSNLSIYARNYFREAQIRLEIESLIQQDRITDATALLVQAYTENLCLVYGNEIADIRKNLKSKLELGNGNAELSLEECCYIFIDSEFSKFQRICFLNFLDNNGFNEPLDIIQKTSFNRNVVIFFLNEICDINMLSKIYWLYRSNEDAINYRIKICEYLMEISDGNIKKIKSEVEELTKNIAIKEHLQNVDKSRISIDAESFRSNVITELSENVNIYNISKKFDYYKFGEYMRIAVLANPIKESLKKMYYQYAQEFCFGDNGVDTSLSTRVRHGTLSNQILRTFTDNHLGCDGHGCNAYFEEQIANNLIDSGLRRKLLEFADKIQKHLNYITQHTLKVFINEPISGAVFDYNISYEEEQQIYNSVIEFDKISVDDFINIVYPLLLKKTNSFLEQIRCIVLPKLKTDLFNELDYFCNEIQAIVNDNLVLKEIEGKIAACKTALQTEFNSIIQWFYITEIQDWEDFDIDVLLDMCIEIEKKLFSDFNLVKISRDVENIRYKGKVFRYFIDILLILFHNAILHSGHRDNLSNLEISVSVSTDSDSVYFVVENNLLDTSCIEALRERFEKYNADYKSYKFLKINTRQEGGMGLYKIMSMLYSFAKDTNIFYITIKDNKVRVEIKMKKEMICCGE